MAKPGISNTATTQTFQNWLDKTNQLVKIVRTDVLTATAGGDVTDGNAILNGNFTASDITSNNGTLYVDTVQLADTGAAGIDINSPVIINGSQKIAATYQFNASGAQTRYTDGSLSWDVGLKDAADYSFIIDTGAGDPEFELTTDGTLNIKNLNVSGTATLGDSSIKLQAQEAFEAGNGIIFVANTQAELVTVKVDDAAVVRADQDSTMVADLTMENHDIIMETSIQGSNGRIRGFNQAGNEALRIEAHNDAAVIAAVGLNESNQNHNLKFNVFGGTYATLDTDMFTIDTPMTINGRIDVDGIIGSTDNANSYIQITGGATGGEIAMYTPKADPFDPGELLKAFELNNIASAINSAEFWGGQVQLPHARTSGTSVTYEFRDGTIRSGRTNKLGSFKAYKGDGSSNEVSYSYGRYGTSETDGYANNMVISGDVSIAGDLSVSGNVPASPVIGNYNDTGAYSLSKLSGGTTKEIYLTGFKHAGDIIEIDVVTVGSTQFVGGNQDFFTKWEYSIDGGSTWTDIRTLTHFSGTGSGEDTYSLSASKEWHDFLIITSDTSLNLIFRHSIPSNSDIPSTNITNTQIVIKTIKRSGLWTPPQGQA